MTLPQISVIIPALNAEERIACTLESLVNQTIFASLEIIVIDDGSTDKTGEIAKSFAEKHDNIIVISEENSGVSAARNKGLDLAKGEYIGFVDADDVIDENYYENLLRAAKDNNSDIATTGFTVGRKSAAAIENIYAYSLKVFEREEAVKAFLLGTIDVHVFTKLFKRSSLNGLTFDEKLTVGEDRIFSLMSLVSANKVIVVPGCGYHYGYNPDSLMSTIDDKGSLENIYVGAETLRVVKEQLPDLLPYAECADIFMKCRLVGNSVSGDLKYNKIYDDLKSEIRSFSLKKAKRHSSSKHYYSLVIAKISPRLYSLLRKNTFLRYKA